MIKSDNTNKRCFVACSLEKQKKGECSCTNNSIPGLNTVSKTCIGEVCAICGKDATNKVGEEIPYDDLHPHRHNLTSYVCSEHFLLIFGQQN